MPYYIRSKLLLRLLLRLLPPDLSLPGTPVEAHDPELHLDVVTPGLYPDVHYVHITRLVP